MLPRVLGDGACLVLGTVVRRVCVDAPAKEGATAVARDGAVVDVVVGDVTANLE